MKVTIPTQCQIEYRVSHQKAAPRKCTGGNETKPLYVIHVHLRNEMNTRSTGNVLSELSNTAEIYIPELFSKKIFSGDILYLSSIFNDKTFYLM